MGDAVYNRDDQRAEEGGPEIGHRHPLYDISDEVKNKSVEDESKKPERQNVQGKG